MTIRYGTIRNALLDLLADLLLPAATREEQARISKLRTDVRALPPLTTSTMTTSEQEWTRNRIKLRQRILTRDPRNFLRWPVVLFTMFHESKVEELDYLKSLPSWPAYEAALAESSIGHPKPYPMLPASSGNLIHHAYSLALLSETFPFQIQGAERIFEFGGGYGSFARLAYQLGFAGTFTLFDLPEFSLLQAYYLSSIEELGLSIGTEETGARSVVLCTNMEKALSAAPHDLFVALWSLSESPLELREEMLPVLAASAFVLIAYQESFNGIDNRAYFAALADTEDSYRWTDTPISHLPGHRYLLGQKKV